MLSEKNCYTVPRNAQSKGHTRISQNRKDYARLVLAINVVFVHGEKGVDIVMLTHEYLIRMVRAERIRKGL